MARVIPHLIESPSTGKIHRWNPEYRRTRCGVSVPVPSRLSRTAHPVDRARIERETWRPVAALEGDRPTCLHCLYPTRADLDAARR